jgi:dipeptidyl aminopeptidase/acylaminoacyl peptidase
MDSEALRQTTFLGDKWLSGKPRAVILNFHGLGWTQLRKHLDMEELAWAKRGGLLVFPYYGPWSWMNREARDMTEEIISAVYREFDLPAETPLISCGGSMGGLSALIFCRYTKRKVAACSTVASVCDITASYTEYPGRPRVFHYAFAGYEGDFWDIMKQHSPLHQVEHMPDIPYLMIHGADDTGVPLRTHTLPFVQAMQKLGRNVEYIEVPGLGHDGEATPIEVIQRRIEYVCSFIP